MFGRIIGWVLNLFGPSKSQLQDQLYTMQAELLGARIEIRKLKLEKRKLATENKRLVDESESAWEMLEDIKRAENFLAGNPKAIQETLESIEDKMLVEMLEKTKPYGEA
tara:strand:+ start:340 stop:666 length:327 start_codon:yes stop_codon:yes gene_type:complete